MPVAEQPHSLPSHRRPTHHCLAHATAVFQPVDNLVAEPRLCSCDAWMRKGRAGEERERIHSSDGAASFVLRWLATSRGGGGSEWWQYAYLCVCVCGGVARVGGNRHFAMLQNDQHSPAMKGNCWFPATVASCIVAFERMKSVLMTCIAIFSASVSRPRLAACLTHASGYPTVIVVLQDRGAECLFLVMYGFPKSTKAWHHVGMHARIPSVM